MNIFPRLKVYEEREGICRLPVRLVIGSDHSSATEFAENLMKEYFRNLNYILEKSGENGFFTFEKIENEKPEYYELSVVENSVTIGYTDALAARNAAATVLALLVSENGIFTIRNCFIQDYADFPYRGFMMDLARQYYEISHIRQTVLQLALAKYTVLHLHLFDTERYAIQTEVLPVLNENPIFRQYSVQEMKDLAKYAASLGLKVIPELDFPGHGLFILEKLPEIKCRVNDVPEGIWTMCVSNEKTYEFIEKLIKEITEIFPDEIIHMGGDELSFYDLKDSGYWPAWDKCDTCRKLKAENGFVDTSDLFCYFVRRVHAILKKYHKRMMIWNDAIDISRSPDIPRDVLIHFWRIAYPTRGPHVGCSLQRFLEEGFDVVNSYFPETYADDYIEEEKLRTWNPAARPETDKQHFNQIQGGELCAWGIREHYSYTLPAQILLFGDRLYNQKMNSEPYTEMLTRQIFCPEVSLSDVFLILGGGIMPLSGDKKYIEASAFKNREAVEKALLQLSRLKASGRYNTEVFTAYIRCLEDLREACPPERKENPQENKGA